MGTKVKYYVWATIALETRNHDWVVGKKCLVMLKASLHIKYTIMRRRKISLSLSRDHMVPLCTKSFIFVAFNWWRRRTKSFRGLSRKLPLMHAWSHHHVRHHIPPYALLNEDAKSISSRNTVSDVRDQTRQNYIWRFDLIKLFILVFDLDVFVIQNKKKTKKNIDWSSISAFIWMYRITSITNFITLKTNPY